MGAGHPISLLMYFTLIAALAIAVSLAFTFLRRRRNRHPMDGQRERNIDEIRRDAGVPPADL